MATFGYTSKGGHGLELFADDAGESVGTPAGGNGTVSKISVYPAGSSAYYLKGVIWLESTKAIITNGVGGTVLDGSSAWLDMNYTTSPTVVNGTNYYVGVVTSGNIVLYCDTGFPAGSGGQDGDNSYATPKTFGTLINNTLKPSIYATYTAAASGKLPQVNIGDVWKQTTAVQINIGDVWKTVTHAQINIGDTWKTIF